MNWVAMNNDAPAHNVDHPLFGDSRTGVKARLSPQIERQRGVRYFHQQPHIGRPRIPAFVG